MKTIKEKQKNRKHKKNHTLYDFLPKEVIDDFIEFKNDPGYKEECEQADEELCEILEDFEYRLGREMTEYEHKTLIAVIRKYSPKNKDGDVFTFLHPETVWEVYWYEHGEKWDNWEEFLK